MVGNLCLYLRNPHPGIDRFLVMCVAAGGPIDSQPYEYNARSRRLIPVMKISRELRDFVRVHRVLLPECYHRRHAVVARAAARILQRYCVVRGRAATGLAVRRPDQECWRHYPAAASERLSIATCMELERLWFRA